MPVRALGLSGSQMPDNRPDTGQKALQINLDAHRYGAFAEIGAGQEVARWFFRVGGAAGTVAKTSSPATAGRAYGATTSLTALSADPARIRAT